MPKFIARSLDEHANDDLAHFFFFFRFLALTDARTSGLIVEAFEMHMALKTICFVQSVVGYFAFTNGQN
jgi:hypothetical protein